MSHPMKRVTLCIPQAAYDLYVKDAEQRDDVESAESGMVDALEYEATKIDASYNPSYLERGRRPEEAE